MLSYIILYSSTYFLQERSMMPIDGIIMGFSFIIAKTNNENNHFILKYICNFYCDILVIELWYTYWLIALKFGVWSMIEEFMLVILNIFSKLMELVHCITSIFISMVKLSNGTVFVREIIVLSCLYLLLDHPYVNNLLNQHN